MTRIRAVTAVLLVSALLAGVAMDARAESVPANFVSETLVPGLNQPTSLAFLPDGRILLTEQYTGYVRLVANGHVALVDPVLSVPLLNTSGYERGLQGIAVDPQWPARPYIYLDYTRSPGSIRVVRYQLFGDIDNPTGENLQAVDPYVLIDDIPDANPVHNAGCLRFAPDGSLFVGVGEDGDPCGAQDLNRLQGKLLRLSVRDLPPGPGAAFRAQITPPDNPFAQADSNARLVFALGLRNPWRFVIDPHTLHPFVADPGDFNYDEINEVGPGDNLGWPWREGPLVVDRPQCPEPGGSGSQSFVPPIVAVGHDGSAQAINTAGVRRVVPGAPDNWPNEYNGTLFYGDYYDGYLRGARRNGATWSGIPAVPGQPDAIDWAIGFYTATEFVPGPDGSLYWLRQFDDTFSGVTGRLGRIRYIGPPADVMSSSPLQELRVFPNPSSGPTRLEFAIARAGEVRLEIFDLSGRHVRDLASGAREAGRYTVEWDGADASGARVRPGVYMARLRREGSATNARVLRLE